ncbi:MAG: hypothetical protein IKR68_02685 [Lachnospiraceae bacterium]|nr:hypothetical protein [Lachnospiraceae bacterium]
MALNINSGGDLSAFFGGTSSANGTSGSSFSLADYASIRNGSYAKLTKAYYKKQDARKAGLDDDTVKEKVSSEEKLAAKATNLKSVVSSLADSKSLFEKKKIKDKDGNETLDYDRDAIAEKLQSFVDAYNETYAAASNSSSKASYNAGLTMAKASAANSGILSRVGISIGEDGKLSLNKDTAKEADINELKSLFSGSGSYADNIGARATMIVNSSNNMINSLYNATGGRSASSASSALDTIV